MLLLGTEYPRSSASLEAELRQQAFPSRSLGTRGNRQIGAPGSPPILQCVSDFTIALSDGADNYIDSLIGPQRGDSGSSNKHRTRMESLLILILFGLALAILIPPIVLGIQLSNVREKLRNQTVRIASLERRIEIQEELEERRDKVAEPEPRKVAENTVVEEIKKPAPVVQPAKTIDSPPPLPKSETPKASPRAVVEAVQKSSPSNVQGPKPAEAIKPKPEIDWEQFLGVKLFAWVGGLIAFLGVVFAVKYSFEQGWISPTMRVIGGGVIGVGLIIGALRMAREKYAVLIQALCSSGILILYGSSFASYSFYKVVPNVTVAFGMMALVTIAAFVLAIRLKTQVVAILGLVGGFLTPILLSTGDDRTLALFGYISLLDIGLIAVALRQRWNHLPVLGVAATVFMQLAWAGKFFSGDRLGDLTMICAWFTALFMGAFLYARSKGRDDDQLAGSAMAIPGLTYLFVFWVIAQGMMPAVEQPGRLFALVFLVNLAPLAMAWLRPNFRSAHVVAGAATFLLLFFWTAGDLTEESLWTVLGLTVLFGAVHSIYPAVVESFKPAKSPTWWFHLFPVAALFMTLVPFFKLPTPSWSIWPAVILINVMALMLAAVVGSLLGVMIVFGLTFIAAVAWVAFLPAAVGGWMGLGGMLVVAAGFAVVFIGGVMAICRWKGISLDALQAAPEKTDSGDPAPFTPAALAQLAASSAIMPFLLLIMIISRVPLESPTPVFAVGFGLLTVALAAARWLKFDAFAGVGLVAALMLQVSWFGKSEYMNPTWTGFAWNLAFAGLLTAFPFVEARRLMRSTIVVASAALALPLHFTFLHLNFTGLLPGFSVTGLLPLLLSAPLFGAAWWVRQNLSEEEDRNRAIAWMAGAVLFMVSLVLPVQFERQWLTLGWALEGAALIWLFRRVPHEGLKLAGISMLGIAFVRLALNPLILNYERSGMAILNWYLWVYGAAIACMIAVFRMLPPPSDQVRGQSVRPWCSGMAGILAFILLNLEIADFFSPEGRLRYDPSGSLAQDMTYSLGWGVFAMGVLALGFRGESATARRVGLGLLVVTILKLFFHDLRELQGLYRVGSLIGLAIVLGLVSFAYQKLMAHPETADENDSSLQ